MSIGHNWGVTEEQVQHALDYLRDSASAAAEAKAERIFCDEYRKSLKAMLMQESGEKAINAQERDAYADGRYTAHLEKLKKAVYEDEFNRARRVAAEMKIEAWRTQQANIRSMKL